MATPISDSAMISDVAANLGGCSRASELLLADARAKVRSSSAQSSIVPLSTNFAEAAAARSPSGPAERANGRRRRRTAPRWLRLPANLPDSVGAGELRERPNLFGGVPGGCRVAPVADRVREQRPLGQPGVAPRAITRGRGARKPHWLAPPTQEGTEFSVPVFVGTR